MGKVSVDIATCVGCGLCEQFCPEIFEIQKDGIAHIKSQNCSTHDIKDVVEQCPVSAIKIA
ncbi:MAG: ferredoxin [Candidatus Omnitrophota bacterium]